MLTIAIYGLILIFLARIAWVDFRELRIPNPYVFVLLGLYLAFAASRGFDGWQQDLMAGAGLFVLGFVFWLLGWMGAGDAKLYFPLGLLCSVVGLFPYIILLSVSSILFFIILVIAGWLKPSRPYVLARLAEIREAGRVPYSIPMVFSLAGVLTLRVFVVP